MKRLLLGLGFAVLALHPVTGVDPVAADVLEISHRDTYEVKKLSLPSGGKADITVYLKSLGETVGGFRLSLVKNPDTEIIETLASDEEGIVRFLGVPAGNYSVIMWRSKRTLNQIRVEIGDIVLRRQDASSDESNSDDIEETGRH